MKIAVLAFAALAASSAVALAQQQPPPDAKVGIYRDLLSEANDRIASASEMNAKLRAELAQAQAELAKLKKPPEK